MILPAISALVATATSAINNVNVNVDRTFTVENHCNFTIWPAVFTQPNTDNVAPQVETGWEALPMTSKQFKVPYNWRSGRIWARQNCDFSTSSGPTSCATGGCNGGLLCDPTSGTGVPPATVAEWTFDTGTGTDWYDVSLVDGFNLPMRITTTGGCTAVECAANVNVQCPADLIGPTDATGTVLGCKSDCQVDPNPTDSPSCCSGSHVTPDTCPSTGVPHYSYFKTLCPQSYVYAYDESSGSLFTCPSTQHADYTLTFCPS